MEMIKFSLRVCGLAGIAFATTLIGCDQEPVDEPRGGGYVANPAPSTEPEPAAKSTLGKAKQAAERVINEDIAEYNKKLEKAADEVFPK